MATFYSDQITKLDQTVPRTKLPAKEGYGRMRLIHFSYRTPASGMPTTTDTVQLCRIPAGAKLAGLYVANEALSTAAGTAGADFGDSGDPDRIVAALDMDAAGSRFVAIRNDSAAPSATVLGLGYEYTAETVLLATPTGEQWAASKNIRGFVVVSVD